MSLVPRPRRAVRRLEQGMSTAEYAVGTLAAAALAAVLFKVLSGNIMVDLITKIVKIAFKVITGS